LVTYHPEEIKYTHTNEWVRIEGNIATIGITDQAQEKLSDITSVTLPDEEEDIEVGDEVATIESVKTVIDVFSPVAGTITEVNSLLLDAPGLINSAAYDDGWLFKVKVNDLDDFEQLLSLDEYLEVLEEQEEDDDA
jgi:glycine cleavage system H protein